MDEDRQTMERETSSPDSPCEEAGRVQRADLFLRPLNDCTRVREQVSEHEEVLQRNAVKKDTYLQHSDPVLLPASAIVHSSPCVAQGHSAKTVRKKASTVNIVEWVSQIMDKGVSLPVLPPLPPGSSVKKVKLNRTCRKEVGPISQPKSDKKMVHKDKAAQRTKVIPKQCVHLVLKRDKKEVKVTRHTKKIPEPYVCSRVRKGLQDKSQDGGARTQSQERASDPVPRVRAALLLPQLPDQAPAHAHGGETLQVCRVRQGLLAAGLPEDPPGKPRRPAPLLLLTLPQDLPPRLP
ncbi:hypothetical protein AALO_G00312030, partial [Alosa alosa]